jgi:ribonuclease BN (tRNA processing enzyme)
MSELSLTFLGVGNASAVELGNASAVLEVDGDPSLLIDCGPTVLPVYLDRYGILPRALFVTHNHFDHFGGLENLFFRLACDHQSPPLVRLFVPAPIIERLHALVADDAFRLAEGGVNFWDRFQLVPVGEHFWWDGLLFDVFSVNHHAYRSAFGLALESQFVFSGDTRPIPEALAHYATHGETVFHDCGLVSNPSHTGLHDVMTLYSLELRERLVAYHYESLEAGQQLAASGLRVARPGESFVLSRSEYRDHLYCVG